MDQQLFMPLATASQSSKIDELALKKYGLKPEMLMETAGALSAKEIISHLKWHPLQSVHFDLVKKQNSVLVLCGPGQNGGDGLVVARHLLSAGVSVKVFCASSESNPLVEAKKDQLRLMGLELLSLEEMELIKKQGQDCSLIVDALFGVGLNRDVKDLYAKLIRWMNLENKLVFSLDTPSGLDVDTGHIRGEAVIADFTFSFGLAKPGFYLQQGPKHIGSLKVFAIGFPLELLLDRACSHFLINEYWVSQKLPQRADTDHKALHGKLLVLAGSEGFWGAGYLSVLSAYRMGAGYVYWAGGGNSPPPIQEVPEVLTSHLKDPDLLLNKTAIAIGPGLGLNPEIKKLLLTLKKENTPVVVDADAFNVCVKENLFPLPSHWVLTPHSGELGRLFGITGREIEKDPCRYALRASYKTGTLVLLKGFHSVLAVKDQCWIIPKGHSALAKAGTGDVLTGFIGALLARSLDPFSATAVGAFLHGYLAEYWTSSGKDRDSLMAQDLKDILPLVLNRLNKNRLK